MLQETREQLAKTEDRLFEAGRDVKQVAAWLGHADPAFTLRTYVHLMDNGVGDADFLDAITAPRDGPRVNAESTERPKTAARQNAAARANPLSQALDPEHPQHSVTSRDD
jgi:hypothetical protein